MNFALKLHYEHKGELEYEVMCKTVEENSQYYTDFANEFLNIVKAEKDIKNAKYMTMYPLYLIESNMKTPLNYDLIGRWEAVIYQSIEDKDVWYVDLGFPYHIWKFDYWLWEKHTYIQEYSIVYIPDEYMTESNLEVIFSNNCVSSLRIGDLYIVGRNTDRI
jgi:hypothetical protein